MPSRRPSLPQFALPRLPSDSVHRRRLLVLAGALALALIVAVVVLARVVFGGGDRADAPSDGALRLVPADALVAVDVSLDLEREATADALATARRFPSFARTRDTIVRRLAPPGTPTDPKEIEAFLGDQAVLALFAPARGSTAAGSLLVIDVEDRALAERFVARGARRSGPGRRYRGVALRRYGAVFTAFAGDRLLLGQPAELRRVIDLTKGTGKRLTDDPVFKDAVSGQPADRVALAYASEDGVTQLLAPAGGPLGAAGTLLLRPGLEGASAALVADDPGARVAVRSVGKPTGSGDPTFPRFSPELTGELPAKVLAYLGVKGLDRAATRILASSSAGAAGVDVVLRRLREQLGAKATRAIQKDLVGLLAGETATTLVPATPAPVLTVRAETKDVDATKAAIAQLTRSVRRLYPAVDDARIDVGGAPIRQFRVGTVRVLVGVVGEDLVLTTAASGIEALDDDADTLADDNAFKAVNPDPEEGDASALVFLDLAELLALGERTGLNGSTAYRSAKRDLQRVEAVGVTIKPGREAETTAEILLKIR